MQVRLHLILFLCVLTSLQPVVHAFTSAHRPARAALPLASGADSGPLLARARCAQEIRSQPGRLYVPVSAEAEDDAVAGASGRLGLRRAGKPLAARLAGCRRDEDGEGDVCVTVFSRRGVVMSFSLLSFNSLWGPL